MKNARLEVYLSEQGKDSMIGVHALNRGWPDMKELLDGGTHNLLCWRDALAKNFLDPATMKFVGMSPETFFGHWTDGSRSLYCKVLIEYDDKASIMIMGRNYAASLKTMRPFKMAKK